MLQENSAEYWAREASTNELVAAAMAARPLSEPDAEILDYAYLERCIRIVGNPRTDVRGAEALAEHLMRIAHDTSRKHLEKLERPYFARWRTLADIMARYAARLDVPSHILERSHVRAILLHLHRAGGRAAQSELTMIANEGQRSVTLRLMEVWELIKRRPNGKARVVVITDLGRLAIADDIAKDAAEAAVPAAPRAEVVAVPPAERLVAGMYAIAPRAMA